MVPIYALQSWLALRLVQSACCGLGFAGSMNCFASYLSFSARVRCPLALLTTRHLTASARLPFPCAVQLPRRQDLHGDDPRDV